MSDRKDILGETFTDSDVEYLEGLSLRDAMIGLYLNAEPPYVVVADLRSERRYGVRQAIRELKKSKT